MTRVVNIRHKGNWDVYIGRAGREGLEGIRHDGYFGNPFRIKRGQNRDQAIARFKNYFLQRIAEDAEFKARVEALRGKRLGCFCKPLPCHGDVIADFLEGRA